MRKERIRRLFFTHSKPMGMTLIGSDGKLPCFPYRFIPTELMTTPTPFTLRSVRAFRLVVFTPNIPGNVKLWIDGQVVATLGANQQWVLEAAPETTFDLNKVSYQCSDDVASGCNAITQSYPFIRGVDTP